MLGRTRNQWSQRMDTSNLREKKGMTFRKKVLTMEETIKPPQNQRVVEGLVN